MPSASGGHLADVLEDAELIEFMRADEYRRRAGGFALTEPASSPASSAQPPTD